MTHTHSRKPVRVYCTPTGLIVVIGQKSTVVSCNSLNRNKIVIKEHCWFLRLAEWFDVQGDHKNDILTLVFHSFYKKEREEFSQSGRTRNGPAAEREREKAHPTVVSLDSTCIIVIIAALLYHQFSKGETVRLLNSVCITITMTLLSYASSCPNPIGI